jgi:hypothetical protein
MKILGKIYFLLCLSLTTKQFVTLTFNWYNVYTKLLLSLKYGKITF